MAAWAEIEAWRRAERKTLLAERLAVAPAQGAAVGEAVARLIAEGVPGLGTGCLGFYWPFRGELDLRPLVTELLARGARAALPAVVVKGEPLEFRPWTTEMTLRPDATNIPAPPAGPRARPAILLVPLLGFDEAGYRLGYGGGYYDRTLAALTPKPLTIGLGYAMGRLPTIHPQPHDVPMDAIVTEDGMTWFERGRAALRRIEDADEDSAGGASPPCFLHELDPSFVGYLSRAEMLALLATLLDAGRAAARAIDELRAAPGQSEMLAAIARAEARDCAMLSRHIVRLGGAPGTAWEAAGAETTIGEPADRLTRWQDRILRLLREAVPRLSDEALAADLATMLCERERTPAAPTAD